MKYSEFVTWLDTLRPSVLELVSMSEAQLLKGQAIQDLPRHTQFPFSDKLWRAYNQNTAKLLGVKRITGTPYATHPTRMALMAIQLIADGHQKELSAFYTIFHDYLEEGDGRTVEGVAKFRQEFPNCVDAVQCAIYLSEPQIDYGQFPERQKVLENVAYVRQLAMVWPQLKESAFINASLIDKLDNIHDLDYITCNPTYSPERKNQRLLEKFGYFYFVYATLGQYADPYLGSMLHEAVRTIAASYGFRWEQVEERHQYLRRLYDQYAKDMQRMIREYHQALGMQL